MSNTNEKKDLGQDILHYLGPRENWRSNKGDIQSLMRRLKQNERKKNNGKFIFVTTAISILVVSGIIISF